MNGTRINAHRNEVIAYPSAACDAALLARGGLMRYSLDEQARESIACQTISIHRHPYPTGSIWSSDRFWVHIS